MTWGVGKDTLPFSFFVKPKTQVVQQMQKSTSGGLLNAANV